MLKNFILTISLITPLAGYSEDGTWIKEICVDDVCFDTRQEAVEYVKAHELIDIGYQDIHYDDFSYVGRRGSINKDNPSAAELLDAAIRTAGTMEFEGTIEIKIESPSGFVFSVTLVGRKIRSEREPPMYSKPEGLN